MKGIPWGEIGAFGSFAVIILIIVLAFVTKWRRAKNSPGTMHRSRCINNGRLQTGLTHIAIARDSISEIKQDMKGLTEKTVEQTGILKGLFSETKEQTRVLEKIAEKIGR